jgi:glycosyltransferase involved in cell wall biosynthesis
MSRGANLLGKTRRAWAVGPFGLAQRIAQRAYRATGAADLLFNLDLEDLLVEIPAQLPVPAVRPQPGRPLRIGWVTTPPAPGSGGHTTLFRIIEALEAAGHHCVLFLYDKHDLDVIRVTSAIRKHWPSMLTEVRDARKGIGEVDAVVATSWESAHLIVKYARSPTRRLYFIQDYEPFFYGHGAEHAFAAMTYRLPFRRIVLGEMLDGMIREQTGLINSVIPFGCDSAMYHLPAERTERSGIVFYCRPDAPRRGYQLACVALMEFHRRHPDQEIHVYGAPPRGLKIPITFHGRMTATALNDLYGRTIAGLAMSFTNITLVAEEMLAAGNIPVINDMPLARRVLPNPHVRWADPTGAALADALCAVVTTDDLAGRAADAAASVVGRSWKPTQDAVVRIVEEEVMGA